MTSYIAHSDLPMPLAYYATARPQPDELTRSLKEFLDRFDSNKTRITFDHVNASGGLVSAHNKTKSSGIWLNSSNKDIQSFLEKQGYQCKKVFGTRVIQCVKPSAAKL